MKFELNIDSAIKVIEENLNTHIIELRDAKEVWVEDLKTALDRFRDAVDRKGLEASHDEVQHIMYKRPVDNRSNYSKYLHALKRAKEDGQLKITVDEDDYDRIFNDNWEWRVSSKAGNIAYSSRKR
jgi:hypothetical protein